MVIPSAPSPQLGDQWFKEPSFAYVDDADWPAAEPVVPESDMPILAFIPPPTATFNPIPFAQADYADAFEDDWGVPKGEGWTEPPEPGWEPQIESPSVFSRGLLTHVLVPRLPSRTYDTRLERFAEAVAMFINGLILTGSAYKDAFNTFKITMRPPEQTVVEAFNGQLFVDSATNRLAFKDKFGVVHYLT